MIQGTLTQTMSVADLVPKAASQPPAGRGDNAFEEALAGAHTVHDRRDSTTTPGRERNTSMSTRNNDRVSSSEDRATKATDRSTSKAERPEHQSSDTEHAQSAEHHSDRAADAADHAANGAAAAAAAAVADAAAAGDVGATVAATMTVQTTVAVAAAPVITAIDAVLVPTLTADAQITTTAVDAAMRLAIGATDLGEAATTKVDSDAAATIAVAADVEVEAEVTVDPKLAALVRGAEDAANSDDESGPTRLTSSTLKATSGPSLVPTANMTEASVDVAVDTDPKVLTSAHLTHVTATQIADGEQPLSTQLLQAVQAEVDVEVDAKVKVDTTTTASMDDAADATTTGQVTTAKVAAGAQVMVAADVEADTEIDVPVVNARIAQPNVPASTLAAPPQVSLRTEAAAAEEAGEGASAPVKIDSASSLTNHLQSTLQSGRPDQVNAGARIREAILGASLQDRIDHIADQLATRLRLSQAAGGSQVNLSLRPRELGDVTVQMRVRDGVVAATVLVENQDTLRTLDTNLAELKRSLENQGLQIQEFSVGVRGEAGAHAGNHGFANSNGRNAATNAGSGIAGAAAVTPGLTGDREIDPEDLHTGAISVQI